MAFIPATNTLRLAINYISANGETATNVIHVRYTLGAITGAAVTALFNALDTWFNTSWAPNASTSWQTDLYSAVDLTAVDGPVYTRVNAISGDNTLGPLPAQNTVAISFRTGLSGRSRRGRLYHVGLSKDQVTASTLASGVAAALITAYSELVDAFIDIDWELVIASFVSNGAPRAAALLTPVNQVILSDPIVDSMDTRKPRDL